MRIADLKRAIAHLPGEATINANFNRSKDGEFSIGCVSYNPKLKVVMLEDDSSEVSASEQVLWNEVES